MATVERASESTPLPENAAQELEKLLKLAEGLEQQCQSWERQITFRWMLAVTVAVLGVTLAVIAWTIPRQPEVINWWVRGISGMVGGIYAAAMTYFVWRIMASMKRNLRRDRRALYEVLGLLREIESAVAQRDNLPALERAEFRIRLSRFDIGPEHDHRPRW